MKELKLKVQSTNSGWRLGLNKFDSVKYFKHRENITFNITNFGHFCIKTACGSNNKKSFDFNGKHTINKWIVENNYHKYPSRKPTELIFELTIINKNKNLKFIKKTCL